MDFLKASIDSVIALINLIGICLNLRLFINQKKNKDFPLINSSFSSLLEGLMSLKTAFLHQGKFIPGQDIRFREFQYNESENEEGKITIATRGNEIYIIARRIVQNCETLISISPSKITRELCKKIRDNFISTGPSKRRNFEDKISSITSFLQADLDLRKIRKTGFLSSTGHEDIMRHDEEICRKFSDELNRFYDEIKNVDLEEFYIKKGILEQIKTCFWRKENS